MGKQRQQAVPPPREHHPAEAELHRAGRAEGVADQRLRRAAGNVTAENLVDGSALHRIVQRRARAVQVQVRQLAGRDSGILERGAHRGFRASALRLGRGHVKRIAGLAGTDELDAAGITGQQEGRGTLAEREALTVHAERIARLVGDRLERVKPVGREAAERIGAAGHHRVAEVEGQQRSRRGQGLRR